MKPDRKKRYKSLPLMVLSQIVLIALAVLIIYPLFFVLMTSFKSNYDVLVNPFGIKTFQPENYVQAWRIGMIGKFFMNSVITTAITLAIQMVVIVMASYAFGKLKPWAARCWRSSTCSASS